MPVGKGREMVQGKAKSNGSGTYSRHVGIDREQKRFAWASEALDPE